MNFSFLFFPVAKMGCAIEKMPTIIKKIRELSPFVPG